MIKKLLIVALAFALAGCGALPFTRVPTATPIIVIQTVLVTVIPTQPPTATSTNTAVPTLTPQVIVVTATPGTAEPTTMAGTAAASVPVTGLTPTATLPANAGGDLFTNLTRSSDHFALKCQPDTITFGITAVSTTVYEVDLYYRTEDQLSVSINDWHNGGKMQSDKHGNFTIDFSAATVDPDSRSHRAWFDYEFVGINRLGQAVGRSAKIVKQITYTIDCSD